MADCVTHAIYYFARILDFVNILTLEWHGSGEDTVLWITTLVASFVIMAIPQIIHAMGNTEFMETHALEMRLLLVGAVTVLGFIAWQTVQAVREGMPRLCTVHDTIVRRLCPECDIEAREGVPRLCMVHDRIVRRLCPDCVRANQRGQTASN